MGKSDQDLGEGWGIGKMTKSLRRVLQTLAIMLVAYIVLYFALMDRNAPALDRNGRVVFKSSYRFGGTQRATGEFTVYGGSATVMNVIFYPIDRIYWATRTGAGGGAL